MALPEFPEQLLVAHHLRIEHHEHRLGVIGETGAHLLVGRVRRIAAGVANRGRVHAGHLPEHALRAPEAAHAELGERHAARKRRRDAVAAHEMPLRNVHALLAARQRGVPG